MYNGRGGALQICFHKKVSNILGHERASPSCQGCRASQQFFVICVYLEQVVITSGSAHCFCSPLTCPDVIPVCGQLPGHLSTHIVWLKRAIDPLISTTFYNDIRSLQVTHLPDFARCSMHSAAQLLASLCI